MANPKGAPHNLTPFQPGQSGNPGGSTQGMRRKIQGRFLENLAADFEAHGREAIEKCRESKPDVYMKVCASLLPKEIDLKNPLDEVDDVTLAAVLAAVRAVLTGATGTPVSSGTDQTQGAKPTH